MEGKHGVGAGVPARLTPREGRKFAFTVGAAFLALAGLMWWRGRMPGVVVFGILGGVLLLAGLVVPGRLRPVYRAWMGLAELLSKVTTPIFMAVVYFVVVTPVAYLRRLLGKPPLASSGATGSVWTERPTDQRRSDLLRQF